MDVFVFPETIAADVQNYRFVLFGILLKRFPCVEFHHFLLGYELHIKW